MEPATGDPPRVPPRLVHPPVGLAKAGTFWQGGGRERHRSPPGPGRGRAPRLQPPAVRSREPPGCWPGKCPCAGPPRARIVPLNLGSVFGALRLPSSRRKGKIKTSPGSVNRIVPRPPGARATRRAARSFLGVSPAAGTPGRVSHRGHLQPSSSRPVPAAFWGARWGLTVPPGEAARAGRASLAEEVGER